MAKNIGEALCLLQRLGQFNISSIGMIDNNKDTTHHIKHKYREELIIPVSEITNNIDFLMGCGRKTVITADNIECNCSGFEEKHICDLENDIIRLYNTDPWSFMKRWYKFCKTMDSTSFVIMKLEKK